VVIVSVESYRKWMTVKWRVICVYSHAPLLYHTPGITSGGFSIGIVQGLLIRYNICSVYRSPHSTCVSAKAGSVNG
jgi:hypothetical protein